MKRFPLLMAAFFLSFLTGCRSQLSSVQRPTGQIELRRPAEKELPVLRLNPATASLSKNAVDVTVRYATLEELDKFFENKEVFGKLAGKNPYPPETLIFFVRVANHSGKRIRVNPDDFVLIDNLNIQYSELSPDNISELYESKAALWSFAKTTGDLAPGPYGAPLKVAGVLGAGTGRKQHYLIKQVRLAGGYVYPGIAYDGYVAFPRPHPNSTSVNLIIANIKMDFDSADVPANAVQFEFSFAVEQTPPVEQTHPVQPGASAQQNFR